MVLFHPVWTTAMPCFLDFHTTYSRGCFMFRMQQQDSLHRNRNITMLLRLERCCTCYQLNLGLIFKVLVHAYKAQHNLSPANLSELITPYRPTRRLRCDEYRLVEHRTNIKHYGDSAFQNAAPKLWNELPMFIRQCDSLANFKHHLKIYLFKKAYL